MIKKEMGLVWGKDTRCTAGMETTDGRTMVLTLCDSENELALVLNREEAQALAKAIDSFSWNFLDETDE